MEEMEVTAAGLDMVQTIIFNNFLHSKRIVQDEEEDFGVGRFSVYQKCLWDLIEHSESSMAAQVNTDLRYFRIFSWFLPRLCL